MSLPRPIRPYYFQADLIWWDGPFEEWANCMLSTNKAILRLADVVTWWDLLEMRSIFVRWSLWNWHLKAILWYQHLHEASWKQIGTSWTWYPQNLPTMSWIWTWIWTYLGASEYTLISKCISTFAWTRTLYKCTCTCTKHDKKNWDGHGHVHRHLQVHENLHVRVFVQIHVDVYVHVMKLYLNINMKFAETLTCIRLCASM